MKLNFHSYHASAGLLATTGLPNHLIDQLLQWRQLALLDQLEDLWIDHEGRSAKGKVCFGCKECCRARESSTQNSTSLTLHALESA